MISIIYFFKEWGGAVSVASCMTIRILLAVVRSNWAITSNYYNTSKVPTCNCTLEEKNDLLAFINCTTTLVFGQIKVYYSNFLRNDIYKFQIYKSCTSYLQKSRLHYRNDIYKLQMYRACSFLKSLFGYLDGTFLVLTVLNLVLIFWMRGRLALLGS